ncbi:MAG: JAB domain-containing protein [Bacteroidales bacterium]|nr:JAB domain-containing protein [Bacteroidales bacterium]
MRCELLNKLGLNLSEDWNVSDLLLASRAGYLEGFSEEQLDKLSVLQEAISEYVKTIPLNDKVQITNADLATFYLYPMMKGLDHEECWILFLSRKNTIIKRMQISKGGFSQTTIDNKQILRHALLLGAHGIIISHNHPTNDPKPSFADTNATKSLENACRAVDLMLFDHIIIADSQYYSFQEEKLSKYNTTVLNALASA